MFLVDPGLHKTPKWSTHKKEYERFIEIVKAGRETKQSTFANCFRKAGYKFEKKRVVRT